MTLKRFFKGKRKTGLPETVSRSLPNDTSGFLAKEFPPLASRAKSPSDVLDFVGHPRSILTVTNPDIPETPPLPVHPQLHQQPIRPIPSPRRASFHSYSYDDDQQRKRTATTPPTLVMPQPIMAVPPTRDTVLRSSSKDKTLVPSQGARATVDKEQPQPQPQQNTSSSSRCSPATLQGLYEQLESYRLEHQEWLRRELEHQKNEEWMMMKLYNIQAQLDQITAHVDTRHQRIFNSGGDDDESSGYASEEDEGEEEVYQHDHEGSLCDRRRYYYHPMRHTQHPVQYWHRNSRHNHNHNQQHRPWPAAMIPNMYYRHTRHRSHHPLPPPPPMAPQLPPYPGYIYTDSWPPVRRQKSSDNSFVSARKKNSIRRSCSADRVRSQRGTNLI